MEYYATDAIGSVRVVFDGAGNVVGRMDFEPFGRELYQGLFMPTERFAQLSRDGEADQDYAQARMYEADLGRFTTPDSLYEGLFEPQRWNRYSYALSNPLSYVDPEGLSGRNPALCTAEIRRMNPNDWHCQPEGGGGFLSAPAGLNQPSVSTSFSFRARNDQNRPGGASRTAKPEPTFFDSALYMAAQFSAGFGDTLTLGLTIAARDVLGVNDVINPCSGSYAAGQYTEMGIELAATTASFGLTALAKNVSQRAARSGMGQVTRGVKGVAANHHKNALKQGLFPTAGLPASVRHHPLNMKMLLKADHDMTHFILGQTEGAAKVMVNPATTGARAGMVAAGCN